MRASPASSTSSRTAAARASSPASSNQSRKHGVVGVDRSSREHDVPGQEAAVGPLLEDEHLGLVVALAHGDHRRGVSDLRLLIERSSSQVPCRSMDAEGPGVVARTIVDEIRRLGPMRFDRFMELALYSPGGYYDEPPVGADRRATS